MPPQLHLYDNHGNPSRAKEDFTNAFGQSSSQIAATGVPITGLKQLQLT